MTTMSREVYEALKEAGASEEKAAVKAKAIKSVENLNWVEHFAKSILNQLYDWRCPIDPLRDKKRELLERICAKDSPAIPIWEKLEGYAGSLFSDLVQWTLPEVIHTIDLAYGAPKTKHQLQDRAREVTRLARRLVKLIRGSKILEYIGLEDCVSKELRAARRWVDHVVSVVLRNKEALDKKLGSSGSRVGVFGPF